MGGLQVVFDVLDLRVTVQLCVWHTSAKFKLHYGDMTDSSCLVKIISEVRPTEIYNLAAQSHVKVSTFILHISHIYFRILSACIMITSVIRTFRRRCICLILNVLTFSSYLLVSLLGLVLVTSTHS